MQAGRWREGSRARRGASQMYRWGRLCWRRQDAQGGGGEGGGSMERSPGAEEGGRVVTRTGTAGMMQWKDGHRRWLWTLGRSVACE